MTRIVDDFLVRPVLSLASNLLRKPNIHSPETIVFINRPIFTPTIIKTYNGPLPLLKLEPAAGNRHVERHKAISSQIRDLRVEAGFEGRSRWLKSSLAEIRAAFDRDTAETRRGAVSHGSPVTPWILCACTCMLRHRGAQSQVDCAPQRRRGRVCGAGETRAGLQNTSGGRRGRRVGTGKARA
jgi:hypothetical protein